MKQKQQRPLRVRASTWRQLCVESWQLLQLDADAAALPHHHLRSCPCPRQLGGPHRPRRAHRQTRLLGWHQHRPRESLVSGWQCCPCSSCSSFSFSSASFLRDLYPLKQQSPRWPRCCCLKAHTLTPGTPATCSSRPMLTLNACSRSPSVCSFVCWCNVLFVGHVGLCGSFLFGPQGKERKRERLFDKKHIHTPAAGAG